MQHLPRLAVLLLLSLALAPTSHAYLDPTSGSMVLQLIIGGIAGVGVVLKMYWHRILGFFGKKGQHDEPQA